MDISLLLLSWYQDNRRILPWRKDKDPYHVWISEIMLQQTRIEAVISYYERFIERIPDIFTLANISEDEIENPEENENVKKVKEYAANENAEVIPLCVKIEEELSSLEKADKIEMLSALGLEESGLDKLIKASYRLLGLMSFLTAGEPEVRAWTIKIGTKAPQAAGKIHSDIERGFIRAEVISFDDFMNAGGSMVQAREKGLVRSEGKDYIMRDGDIVLFKFNV